MASQIEYAARAYVKALKDSRAMDPTASTAIMINKASENLQRVVADTDVETANDGDQIDVYRTAASDYYGRDGEIEIDDDAVVSIGEDGAYVAAWVFIQSDAVVDELGGDDDEG